MNRAARYTWLVLALAAVTLAVLVAVANRGDVIFRLDPLPLEITLPLYALIFICVTLGILLGWGMSAWSAFRKRRREKARLANGPAST